MTKVDLCNPGKYTVIKIEPWSNRLQELGFIPNKELFIIANNALGIRIRINNAVYLFDKDTASAIYVEKIED